MDVDALRAQNQEKAEQEAQRGPAREQPDAAPIGDAIRAYHERGDLSFGIPALARATATSPAMPPTGPAIRRLPPTSA